VVALDSIAPVGAELLAASAEITSALRGPAWREVLHGVVETNYLPTDDPERRRRAHAEVDRMAQHVAAAVPEQVLRWDAEAALRACAAPILYVQPAGGGVGDVDRLRELRPDAQVRVVAGIGHDQLVDAREVDEIVAGFVAARRAPARG
jgi:hypothetical protein